MADSEKVTINLSVVDLGKIDLLVEEGFYANRTDLIRTAVRNQLDLHQEAVRQSIVRRSMAIGVLQYGRKDLERYQAAGEKLAIKAIGMVVLEDDITPELAKATIEQVKVLGVLKVNKSVRQVLAGRIS
jgi:Arc/MetJ-type ribon-helix-helix transcriptional regulator